MARRALRRARTALQVARTYAADKDVRSGLSFYQREGRWPGSSHAGAAAPRGDAESFGVPPTAPSVPVPRVRLGEIARGGGTFERLSASEGQERVNLVLPGLDVDRIYAGLLTAMTVGLRLAEARGTSLRLVLTSEAVGRTSVASVRDWFRDHGFEPARAAEVDLVERAQVPTTDFSTDDVWVATYWTTAHALDLACRKGTIDRRRVVYLVQDFEPSFNAWSDQYAIAESTYRAGFTPLVNSTSLANYLEWSVGLRVDAEAVFAPHLDVQRLQTAAASWQAGDDEAPRLFFYARPRHPRNLFRIGIEAVQRFAVLAEAEGLRPVVTTAGDLHQDVDLTPRTTARSVGKLSLSDYYALLGRSDLGLALMQSPHPSHMPLELAAAGVPTVTNGLGGFRGDWHPLLVREEADPDALAGALLASWARRSGEHRYEAPHDLGRPLEDAVATVASKVRL